MANKDTVLSLGLLDPRAQNKQAIAQPADQPRDPVHGIARVGQHVPRPACGPHQAAIGEGKHKLAAVARLVAAQRDLACQTRGADRGGPAGRQAGRQAVGTWAS